MTARRKMRKAHEAGRRRRREPADRKGMRDQMRIAVIVIPIRRGTGGAGRTGRGAGATAGVMTRRMMRMCLEVKKGGAAAATSGVITGGMHLTVTLVAASPQMRRSDPTRGGSTAGQRTMGWMRTSDMVIGEPSLLRRRAGTARRIREEH
jgi:hypothetical protein